MDNVWVPWVFAIIAGIIGWLLRWWYDEGKISEYKDLLQEKSDDVYHLNEAHSLLLKDKNNKISTFQDEQVIKDRVISELNTEIKSLKSQLTIKSATGQQKEKKPKIKAVAKNIQPPQKEDTVVTADNLSANSIVSKIDKQAKGKISMVSKVVTASSDDAGVTKADDKVEVPVKPISETQRLKKKLDKKDRTIKKLLAQRDQLKASLDAKPKEIIKERPVRITTEILVKESIDRKKLKKVFKKIPYKKSKTVVSKKVKKGKLKIVKS